MKCILAVAILAAMIGCSREPMAVQSIAVAPHQMSVKQVEPAVTSVVTSVVNIPVVKFLPIFFDLGKADINPNQMTKLDGHANTLTTNTNMRMQLVGNASSEGDITDNKQLAQMRADVIKNYLIAAGIDAGRMLTTNRSVALNQYGGSKEMLNRRVDFVVLP